jgi:hypothetical protein
MPFAGALTDAARSRPPGAAPADELDLDGLAGLDAVAIVGDDERVDVERRRQDVRLLAPSGARASRRPAGSCGSG